MTANDIRASFLKFFEHRGHRNVSSSPLVPADDPTLLFTNAGMNQFKDVFLGRETRDYKRATSSQKCMRVSGKHNDLDNVGPSPSHHTFFQMLGNFSFGDYFKKEAIAFAWELLSDVWKIPSEKLHVTVFSGEAGIPRDEEARAQWLKFVPEARITELGLEDNFWQMAETGPCGRCSEIYYFRGNDPCPEPVCRGVACSCSRYVEIWNNVFMEFERSVDGTLTPLPAPSIDTGMGFERIVAVLQGKDSNYDTDLFTPILQRITELTGVPYGPLTGRGSSADSDVHMRVIADHSRAMTFLIADGVIPSNEWRGYVLRKIMRRAMRHGKHLLMREPFLYKLVEVIAREMGDAYPELRANREMVEKTILAEEHRFEAVLSEGLPRLEGEIARVLGSGGKVLPGDVAFQLYDTFGVPYDFIEDTAATQQITVDRAAYDRAMEAQRNKARAQSAFGGTKKTEEFILSDEASLKSVGDHFEGYTTTSVNGAPVVALFDEARHPVESLASGSTGYAALERTPFYLESGGQVSDSGKLRNPASGASADVEGLVRIRPGLPRAHRVRLTSGALHVGDTVTADVDADVRDATRRNHTATHLLHAALRQVLGSHVKQAGSLVAPDRLRFDFTHFQAIAPEELDRIERIVNEQIVRNIQVETEVRSTDEAIKAGAMALFGEKYGDNVRVVSIPDFSMELCGGTHVRATGDIGLFVILSESGVASGVRRIDALTGSAAFTWAQHQRSSLKRLVLALGVNEDQAVEAIERLQSEGKRLAREVTQLKTKVAMGGGGSGEPDDIVDVQGVPLLRRKVTDLDKDALRNLTDSLKSKLKSGVLVLACAHDGKVQVVVSVTPDLIARVKAGQIVKEIAPIVGGSGGGRPDFAEAGGKQPQKIDEMLAAAEGVLKKLLSAS